MDGVGVILRRLGGNRESSEVFRKALNQTIARIRLENDKLHLEFKSGYRLKLWDNGQSCCESRYMRTDDRLEDFVGAELVGGEVSDAPSIADKYGQHEVQFLRLSTTKGVLVLSSHNEHNGYYGGFAVEASEE